MTGFDNTCFACPSHLTPFYKGVLGARGAQEHGRVELCGTLHRDFVPQAQRRGEASTLHRQTDRGLAGDWALQGKLTRWRFRGELVEKAGFVFVYN